MTDLIITPRSRYIIMGGSGTFSVIASGKQRFDTFQLTIDFDPEVLQCTAASVPTAAAAIWDTALTADIDNGRGLLTFASTGTLADIDDLTDSVTLLSITFKAVGLHAGSSVSLRTTAAAVWEAPANDGQAGNIGPVQIQPCRLDIEGQEVLGSVVNAAVVTYPLPSVPTAARSSSPRTRSDIIEQAFRKILGPKGLSPQEYMEGVNCLSDIMREESLRLSKGEKALWTLKRGVLFLRENQVSYGTAEQWIGWDGGIVRRVDSTNDAYGGSGLLSGAQTWGDRQVIPSVHKPASATAPTVALSREQTFAQFAGLAPDIQELLSVQYRDLSGDDTMLKLYYRQQWDGITARTDTGEPTACWFQPAADLTQQVLSLDQASSVGADTSTPDTVIGSDGNVYTAIIGHTSSRYNRPVDGADWQNFWSAQGLTGSAWAEDTTYSSAPCLVYTYRRKLQSFDNAGDLMDFPEGWERYLIYRLAYDLAATYGLTLEHRAWLKQEYRSAYETIFQSAREQATDHHNKVLYY